MVGDGDPELRGLPGEDRFHTRETDLEADEVPLAAVHRDES